MNTTSGEMIQPLQHAVAGLLDADLTRLSDHEVEDVLRGMERCARQLSSASTQVVVETVERSIPSSRGYNSPQKYLIEVLRLSSQDAYQRVQAARNTGVWHTLSGQPLPPTLPHTATARTEGAVSAEHARRIALIMKKIPNAVSATERATAEKVLAAAARRTTPDDLDILGRRLLAYLDPDGKITDDHDRKRRRGLTIGRQGSDLMTPIRGELDPEARALLEPLLAKWARPGVNNPADPDSPTGDASDAEAIAHAAERDTRTAAQRNHDALAAICRAVLEEKKAGSHRGLPVTAVFSMAIDQLEKAAGVATTASGGIVPIKDALRMAEKAHPILVLFDHNGRPLHLGRERRLASADQRLALFAAERGCTRPGCDAPASMCTVHHVREWADDGTTDIENLTFACEACHGLVNPGPNGWVTVTGAADSDYPGRTHWISARNPDGPHVNHRHHPDELIARALRDTEDDP